MNDKQKLFYLQNAENRFFYSKRKNLIHGERFVKDKFVSLGILSEKFR